MKYLFLKIQAVLIGVVLLGALVVLPQNLVTSSMQSPSAATPQASAGTSRNGLNIVVIDPAHGGTDPGARGVGGVRESDIVLDLAAQVRHGLEAQGFQVMQTRSTNENPSFDDRSALANAQTGAIFLTLHVSSTGLPGTVRVYTMPDMPLAAATGGLIPWEQAG
jgi:N-acetylmuramoyl-L-alanine amidase